MTTQYKPIRMSHFLKEEAEPLDPKFYTAADEDFTYDAIVVGAGVIGPCIAKCLAQKGKKVLIVEREWQEPDRIVGELMQPGGVRALRELGMIQAINNINAQPITGYTVMYNGEKVTIDYSHKAKSGPLIYFPRTLSTMVTTRSCQMTRPWITMTSKTTTEKEVLPLFTGDS